MNKKTTLEHFLDNVRITKLLVGVDKTPLIFSVFDDELAVFVSGNPKGAQKCIIDSSFDINELETLLRPFNLKIEPAVVVSAYRWIRGAV